MKLLFDEDLGKGVPEALRGVGLRHVSYVRQEFRERLAKEPHRSIQDEEWIRYAGLGGWLVVSANQAILRAEAQRQLWIDYSVGGVFLAHNNGTAVDLLKLFLRKWDWLETVDRHQPRPFAYILTLRGRTRLDPRV